MENDQPKLIEWDADARRAWEAYSAEVGEQPTYDDLPERHRNGLRASVKAVREAS